MLNAISRVASSTDTLVDRYTSDLLEKGYVIIRNVIGQNLVDGIREDTKARFFDTPFCKGLFYGSGTKRMGSLLARSPCAAEFVQHEFILKIVKRVLLPFAETIGLNLTQAIEIHPNQGVQVPHRDQDMWGGPKGDIEYLVNVMWPFSPYTKENGATRIWPGSHKRQGDMILPEEAAIDAEMEPGSALLFLGSTLHSAGANVSTEIRRGMIISYCLGWLKPYENQWLCYPPEVARHFSPELADLVGYHMHRPNLGNYEGQCPSVLLKEARPDFLGAIDHLRPDQEDLIRGYLSGELKLAA